MISTPCVPRTTKDASCDLGHEFCFWLPVETEWEINHPTNTQALSAGVPHAGEYVDDMLTTAEGDLA